MSPPTETNEIQGAFVSPAKDRSPAQTGCIQKGTFIHWVSSLVLNKTDVPTAFAAVVEKMFSVWGATTFLDLISFSGPDVVDFFENLPDAEKVEFTGLLFRRRLEQIVEYAHTGGEYKEDILYSEIVAYLRKPTVKLDTSVAPAVATTSTDKKTIPTLKPFSGTDEDWFHFKENTNNILGRTGLVKYLSDAAIVAQNREIAESVFFAIRQALTDGHANHLSQKLFDQDNLNPKILWEALVVNYDTTVKRQTWCSMRFAAFLAFG